jgi:hypothetical protein
MPSASNRAAFLWSVRGWQREGTDVGKQGIGACSQYKRGELSCARLAAEGKPDRGKPGIEALCPTGIGGEYAREALCEDRLGTVRRVTEKAPNVQLQAHGHPLPGEVSRMAHIARLDALGALSTLRTVRTGRPRAHHGSNRVVLGA